MVYSVKKKELYAYIYRKYHRTCPSTMTESTKFFLFAVVFLLPLCSFSFFFFSSLFSISSLFSFSLYYILWHFYHFLHPRVGQVLEVLFFMLLFPLLEPSILSCKAACSLFRHHLHINAARELMQGQQYSQIFIFSNSYPLYDIFSSTLWQGLSKTLS